MKTVLPYLTLGDIAKLITLNKQMLEVIFEIPHIIIYMINTYYLNVDNVHPSISKYFGYCLAKRLAQDTSSLSQKEQKIISLAFDRLRIIDNIVLNPYMENKSLDGWRIIRSVSDAWSIQEETAQKNYKYSLSTNYWLCEMAYKAEYLNFPTEFRTKFAEGKAVIKAGCWISRTEGYDATGGCRIIMYDRDQRAFFIKNLQKESHEIPTDRFHQIQIEISRDELPNLDRISNGSLELQIFRNDEKVWSGHYGTRFWGMYIQGDFLKAPLDTFCL